METEKLQSIVGKLNVLYAEDDLDVLSKSKKIFEQLFASVDTVTNGQEALDQYKRFYSQNNTNYDIVISDIKMPVMDGAELAKNIKKLNDKQIILIISAHNESEILQNLINVGITYFIHKPIQFEELIKVISIINDELQKEYDSKERVDEVMKLNKEFEALLAGYDNLIIASRTDIDGKITYVSKAFETISQYSSSELLGNTHAMIRHPDMPKSLFIKMWDTIKEGKIWKGKIKNKKKNGDTYWTNTSIAPYFDKEGNILGYNSIREDITNQVQLKELHKKVNVLLNHANDGYLLIDKDMIIQEGYSSICHDFFGINNLFGHSLEALLFSNDHKKRNLFIKGIEKIYQSDDKNKNELYLSLLPQENLVNGRFLNITYKIIDNQTIMVIIQDNTEKMNLKSELETKQKYQKMIIHVISNIHDFLELKKDFEKFFKSIYQKSSNHYIHFDKNEQTQLILRQLHTFKGLFYQMQMTYTPDAIHHLETFITKLLNGDSTDSMSQEQIDIRTNFKEDLQIIEDTLGKEYFLEYDNSENNKKIIKKIKYQLRNLINQPINVNFKLQNIISQIDLLSYIDVTEVLSKHISLVAHLSELLEKPMEPLSITGERDLKVPPTFKNFFRNLVHVYKNSVDHGIEDIETRLLLDKNEQGKISCEYYYLNKFFHLIIKDDGSGVNIEKLTSKAINEGIITKEQNEQLSTEEKLQLIFVDNLSTKDTANEISGRGVGMAALKDSCEALNGQVSLKNEPSEGLEYHFQIPLVKLLDSYASNSYLDEMIHLLETISNRIKLFFKQELSIEVIDARFIESSDLSNKVNTMIEIINGKDRTQFAFSYTTNIVQKFAETYFGDIMEETEFQSNINEYSNEMINTLVGLAIQDFPPKYIDGMLGTPKNLLLDELENKIQENENNKILTILIQTNLGNMVCRLIHDK